MTETQVYRLERGERPNLYAITLARIALALDTNIEYLLGLTDSIHSPRCWAGAYREGDQWRWRRPYLEVVRSTGDLP